MLTAQTTDDFLSRLGDDVDRSVAGFLKAYKVIESCESIEQLDMARSYVHVLEQRLVPRLLPICEVLHTMLSIKLGEVRSE